MRQQSSLKPQDVLVLLKRHLQPKERPRLIDLAMDLDMSPSEVSQAIKRGAASGLCDLESGKPFPAALREFVVHGLRYVFPVQPGYITVGIPTSHSAPPLNNQIVSDEPFVWPDPLGKMRGQSLEPLYSSAPKAAQKDSKLYELLALIDALRVGKPREKKLAIVELEKRLK